MKFGGGLDNLSNRLNGHLRVRFSLRITGTVDAARLG